MLVDPQPPVSVQPVATRETPATRPSAPVSRGPATPAPNKPNPIQPSKDTADITHEASPSQVVVSYHFSEPGRRLYFEVIDAGTGKVIRQIPPAAVLNDERRVAEYLEEQAKLHQQQGAKRQG